MSAGNSSESKPKLWVRENPKVLRPNRAFGGYYRSADKQIDGSVFRGVPLQTAEDAVVAAVRMGYRVVDEQIDRGMRIAGNLRSAANRVGSGEPKQLLDNTEKLISKSVLSALQWIEGAAADPDHPLRRLVSAEYRMLGALFGMPFETTKSKPRGDHDSESSSSPPKPDARFSRAAPRAVIVNPIEKTRRRPIKKILVLDLYGDLPEKGIDLEFRLTAPVSNPIYSMIPGGITRINPGKMQLSVKAETSHASGIWCAGIFDSNDEQIGLIEIEL
jgi:hypothetical protein